MFLVSAREAAPCAHLGVQSKTPPNGSHLGWFCPPEDMCNVRKHVRLSQRGIEWVEVRGPAQYPVIHHSPGHYGPRHVAQIETVLRSRNSGALQVPFSSFSRNVMSATNVNHEKQQKETGDKFS